MELGRLEQVPVREIWPHEARHFTPWMLEHADHLGEALGIDLDLEEGEHDVGDFALDLIGRDLSTGDVVIVENQLEATNHTHLGQILTYAAGTDAGIIVWISTSFREEHRQAIDWLNEHTAEELRFFGVELGAVRIGDSAPAPLLRVVSQPNDWQKHIRTVSRVRDSSGRGALYRAFWSRFLTRLNEVHPDWTRAKSTGNNYISFRSQARGVAFNLVFSEGDRLSAMLWIDVGDAAENVEIYRRLEKQKTLMEETAGTELLWDFDEGRKAQKVIAASSGRIEDEEHYEVFISWLIETSERLRRALDAVELDE